MRKRLFYIFCIGGLALYVWGSRAILNSFDDETLYAFVGGFFLAGAMLFLYDRYIHRISGDPDHLRWWEAPAKDFIAAEKADCKPAPRQSPAEATYSRPEDDLATSSPLFQPKQLPATKRLP